MSECVRPFAENPYNFVFDTNNINRLAVDTVAINNCISAMKEGYCFYITDVQQREFMGWPDRKGTYSDPKSWHPSENYKQIYSLIDRLNIQYISCVALLLEGFWTLDGSMRILDDEGSLYEMFQSIHNKNRSHLRDATIAEATIYNHCKLVTNDKRLRNKMNLFFPGTAITYKDFIDSLNSFIGRSNHADQIRPLHP